MTPLDSHPARVRVVNVVAPSGSPVGGVAAWAVRLPGALASVAPWVDLRTLWIAHDPAAWDAASWRPDLRPGDALLRLDGSGCNTDRLMRVVAALEALSPDLVIANHSDVVFMAAGLLRARGVKVIAAARSDEPYVRELFARYPDWDGAMAVSDACREWLEPIASGRPVAMTPSGAPIAPAPRVVPKQGPLRLAYVGRLAQTQKRILDLARLAHELTLLRVDFTLDIVGDGPDEGPLREAMGERPGVCWHGALDLSRAGAILARADVLVLVSAYEGTSIAMQEAMAQGVVPVVTDVTGVRAWLTPGVSGEVVPVGDMPAMARALSRLAADRGRLASLGQAAWARARDALSPEATTAVYADLITRVMARGADHRASDAALHPMELGAWTAPWSGDPAGADRAVAAALRRAGYTRIVRERPTPGCDAVLITSSDLPPTPAEVAAWRARGLGVAIAPTLRADTPVMATRRAIMLAQRQGARRIALFGGGAHTRKVAAVLAMGFPIVGIIDRRAGEPGMPGVLHGVPVVHPDQASELLGHDAVVLSSDSMEEVLWQEAAPWRDAGLIVLPVYRSYAGAPAAPASGNQLAAA